MSTGSGAANTAVELGVIRDVSRKFIAVLSNSTILAPNAMIVLCGEDALPRLDAAVIKTTEIQGYISKQGIRDYHLMFVLSGGRHDPPRWWGAKELRKKAETDSGISPSHLIIEDKSQNTKEQAANCVQIAIENNWRRLWIVVSPYHAFRAFLTFLRALQRCDKDRHIHLQVLPTDFSPWVGRPWGMEEVEPGRRVDLFDEELRKCELYGDDVASYADGLAYLEFWEGNPLT